MFNLLEHLCKANKATLVGHQTIWKLYLLQLGVHDHVANALLFIAILHSSSGLVLYFVVMRSFANESDQSQHQIGSTNQVHQGLEA